MGIAIDISSQNVLVIEQIKWGSAHVMVDKMAISQH